MKSSLAERVVSLYEDATVWQERHRVVLEVRKPPESGTISVPMPSGFSDYEVWASPRLNITAANDQSTGVVEFETLGGENDLTGIIAKTVLREDRDSITALGSNVENQKIYEVMRSNVIWHRSDGKRAIVIAFEVLPKPGEALVTLMCVHPPQTWERNYAFVIQKTPTFKLEEGYTTTFVQVQTVTSVPKWQMTSGLSGDTLVLKRGRLDQGNSGTQPSYQKRFGGREESFQTRLVSDSGPSVQERTGVPSAQLFSNVSLEPGSGLSQQRVLLEGMMPFARIYDCVANCDAIMEILDISEESLRGDLRIPFRIDPAPITFVDENGDLMARNVRPSGKPEILQLSTVDGVRVSRTVVISEQRLQPIEQIRIRFNNERGTSVDLEIWEHGAARIEVKNNANIEISKSRLTINPDPVDGTLGLPIRIKPGESVLVYELFYYARK